MFYDECRCKIHISVSDTNSLLSAEDSAQRPPRFLMIQPYAAIMVFWVWVCSTFPHSPSKRAVAIAIINMSNALGNVASSYIWPRAWGKSYRYSYAICMAMNGLAIVMILCFRAHLKALNEKAEREEQARGLPRGYRYLL